MEHDHDKHYPSPEERDDGFLGCRCGKRNSECHPCRHPGENCVYEEAGCQHPNMCLSHSGTPCQPEKEPGDDMDMAVTALQDDEQIKEYRWQITEAEKDLMYQLDLDEFEKEEVMRKAERVWRKRHVLRRLVFDKVTQSWGG